MATKSSSTTALVAQRGEEALVQKAQIFADATNGQEKALKAYEFVGAAIAMGNLVQALNSQVIQAWEQFQAEEGYKHYGCKTFVEFLDKHPRVGLTKNQYYDRKKLLEAEGADAFDLLNSMEVPTSLRKRLGAGTVQIEGNELIVAEKRIPLDDPKKVKRALSEVIEEIERVELRVAKTEKENEKLKTKLDDAKALAREAASAVPFNDNTDPANQAYMRVVASLTELTRELSEMDTDEAEGRLASYRPGISQAVENCFTFSAATSPTRRPNQPKPNIGLSSDDLADLMED